MALLKRRKGALPLTSRALPVKEASDLKLNPPANLTDGPAQAGHGEITYPSQLKVLDNGTVNPDPGANRNHGQYSSDPGSAPPPGPGQLSRLLSQALEEVYATNGNKTRARAYFEQVLRLDPFNESALLWLGYLTEDVDRRVALFEYAVSLYPYNAIAQAYLKEALARREQVEELVAHATKEDFWERSRRAQARRQHYIPHLGEYLVARGLVTQAQLDEALALHHELLLIGSKKKLGEILVEKGWVAQHQLDYILLLQQAEFNSYFKD